MFEVIVNKEQVKELKVMLKRFPRTVPRILTRAINKVGVAARTKVLRKISETYNVTQKNLKKYNVRLVKANFRTLAAKLGIKGKRVPISHFKARQTKRGVTYAVKKRRRTIYAFMESGGRPVRMSTGHKGVFGRKVVDGKRVGRLPIIERFGPSVPYMYQGMREFAGNIFEREIGQNLSKQINVQTDLVLKGLLKRGVNIS